MFVVLVLFIFAQMLTLKLNKMDNKDVVVKAFQETDRPLKTGEVAQMTGIDSKEIGKIIKKLKTDGVIDSPKRCYYAIKKD